MAFTEKNPKWFYTLDETPELKILETNYASILEELNNLRKSTSRKYWWETFPDYVGENSKSKWQVFSFQFLANCIPLKILCGSILILA